MNAPLAIVLRPARLQDAPGMAEMSRELIEAGLEWRYTPGRMAALIRDAETIALVACEGERLQGFSVMHFDDDDAHLILLCVQPDRQRRGIGRRLVEWLTASAEVAGMARIELELRADNEAALAFYRRLGFVEKRLVPAYYAGWIAARKMQRLLRAASLD